MFKTLVALLLTTIAVSANAQVVIRQIDPLAKVLPGATLPPVFSFVQGAGVNDHLTVQLALLSTKPVSVVIQTSSRALSRTLLSAVKTYKVGLVNVTDRIPVHGSDRLVSESNMYPDPLIPTNSLQLEKNKIQCLYLDLYIDSRYPKGVQSIQVNAVSNGKILATTTVSFQLFNAIVPSTKLSYVNWYHDVNYSMMNDGKAVQEFSPLYWSIFKNTVQVAKEFGQNSFAINPLYFTKFKKKGKVVSYDFTNLNKAVDIILNQVKMQFVVARQFGMRVEGWESEFGLQTPSFYGDDKYMMIVKKLKEQETTLFYKDFLKAYYNNYKTTGVLPKVLQHLADEPISSNIDSYIEISQLVKSVAPDLRIIEATMTAKAFPFIDVVVVPFSELPALQKDVNELLATRKKQVWLYTSLYPQGESANRFIEQPLIKTVLLPWIATKYNFSGYLHWGLNFWPDDPFKDAALGSPFNLPGGDAFIVYPGDKTVNPSIRYLAIRNGLYDAALFSVLKTKQPQVSSAILNDLVRGYADYNLNNLHYLQLKKRMLTLVSKN